MHLVDMPKGYDDEKETKARLEKAANTRLTKAANGKIYATYVKPEKEKRAKENF